MGDRAPIRLRLNGAAVRLDVNPSDSLADVLRDTLVGVKLKVSTKRNDRGQSKSLEVSIQFATNVRLSHPV
jgi:aerobic-type carbon monoxide dehydrogenase small subunit (CoxS/CutS family)